MSMSKSNESSPEESGSNSRSSILVSSNREKHPQLLQPISPGEVQKDGTKKHNMIMKKHR